MSRHSQLSVSEVNDLSVRAITAINQRQVIGQRRPHTPVCPDNRQCPGSGDRQPLAGVRRVFWTIKVSNDTTHYHYYFRRLFLPLSEISGMSALYEAPEANTLAKKVIHNVTTHCRLDLFKITDFLRTAECGLGV